MLFSGQINHLPVVGRQAGGNIGRFEKRTMAKEFEEIAFSCPLNKIQRPVKSEFGYHIINVHRRSDVPDAASKILKINVRVLFGMPEGSFVIPNEIVHCVVGETHRRCALVQNLAKGKEIDDFLVTVVAPGGIWRLDVGPPPNFTAS